MKINNFDKYNNLITKSNNFLPVIIQDYQTLEVLMLGYMNQLAYKKTIETGWVYFWSRKRNKLWLKGEKSGNKLKVKAIFKDCDSDAVLIKAILTGNGVCHTGNKSCFYNQL